MIENPRKDIRSKTMTLAPEKIYELPSPGQHTGVLIDERDLGMVPNQFEPNKPPRHLNRLIFAVEETGSDGKPLQVRDDVNLVRSQKGTLYEYVSAFVYPAAITSGDWDTERHIGKSVGLIIAHNPKGTWANITSVFPLPKSATRLPIPAGYVREKLRNPAADKFFAEAAARDKAQAAQPVTIHTQADSVR